MISMAVDAQSGAPVDHPPAPEAAHRLKNPLPKTKQNMLAGAGVYKENCSGCHGPEGTPVRKFGNLARQPATLTQATIKDLTDGDLAWVLLHGAPGGMPSFAEDLSDTQRWQCIQFVRRLGKDAGKYTAELEAPDTGKAKH